MFVTAARAETESSSSAAARCRASRRGIPPLKRQSPRSRGQADEDREGVAHLLPPRCLQLFSVHGTDLLFTVEGLKSSREGTYRTVSKALEMVECSEYKSDFFWGKGAF